MLKKLFTKKATSASENSEAEMAIKSRIFTMNLTDMKAYINNNIKDFHVCSYGLNEVLRRVITPDASTKKYYLSMDDMDSKKKKAFDLFIVAMKNSQITLESLELMKTFLEVYAELIADYDKKNKEIYSSRLKDSINTGLSTLEHLLHFKNQRSVLS